MPEPGDLVPWYNKRTKRQEWQLLLPELCSNGHRLEYPNVHLTHRGCLCRPDGISGHTVVICLTCNDEQQIPACLTPE